jgi:hypothetical protein
LPLDEADHARVPGTGGIQPERHCICNPAATLR